MNNKNLRILTLLLKSMPFTTFFFRPEPLLEALKELERSDTTIDIKIQKVNESLQETSQIIKELESELIERSKNLELLQLEYEKYSKLAEIEKEKAAALLAQVDHSVNKGKKTERWTSFWISSISGIVTGLIIFILGIIFSPLLTEFFSNLIK